VIGMVLFAAVMTVYLCTAMFRAQKQGVTSGITWKLDYSPSPQTRAVTLEFQQRNPFGEILTLAKMDVPTPNGKLPPVELLPVGNDDEKVKLAIQGTDSPAMILENPIRDLDVILSAINQDKTPDCALILLKGYRNIGGTLPSLSQPMLLTVKITPESAPQSPPQSAP